MKKDIVITCGCGSPRKLCRVQAMSINPRDGEVLIEIMDHDRVVTEAMMYLDRKGAKDLVRAGQLLLKTKAFSHK